MAETIQSSAYISFTGIPGVGKSLVSRMIDSLSPKEIDPLFSKVFNEVRVIPMRQLLAWHGYDEGNDWRLMREYHKRVRESGKGGEVFLPLGMLDRQIVIVDSIRSYEDASHFRQMGGMSLALVAPEAVAQQRFITDTFDDKHRWIGNRVAPSVPDVEGEDHKLLIQRLRTRVWESANDEVQLSGIRHCIEDADGVINADASPADVVAAAIGHIRGLICQRQAEGSLISQPVGAPSGRGLLLG